ncbi:MAG: inositol monophosphatase family protein [Planctomycetota bacterium]
MNPDQDATTIDGICEVAEAAAVAAGEILKSHAGRHLRVDETHHHDLKLEVDRLCEQAVVESIRSRFPQHGILAEERGGSPDDSEYYWIIDPLDGTVNYFHGLPYYCCSVACYRPPAPAERNTPLPRDVSTLGRPVAAVVFAPATDELFCARAGGGATRNGHRIQASEATSLDESMICMGFGKTTARGRLLVENLYRLAEKVRKLRCMGAAAYDICNVAAGRLTGFVEKGLRSWDIAAGRLILEEAGGRFTAEEYAEGIWSVLATAPGIHDALAAELAPSNPD